MPNVPSELGWANVSARGPHSEDDLVEGPAIVLSQNIGFKIVQTKDFKMTKERLILFITSN